MAGQSRHSMPTRRRCPTVRSLLSPIDLQCIKAAGVTFAVSAIERACAIEIRVGANSAEVQSVKLVVTP